MEPGDHDSSAATTAPAAAGAHELRFDPLTREWVLLVPHRQGRPNLPDRGCPFCVGDRKSTRLNSSHSS